MNSRFIFILSFLFSAYFAQSQKGKDKPIKDTATIYKTFSFNSVNSGIIPPSPEVENYINFINSTVNTQTGACNLEIPLYEIKCGSLRLPVTLNYYSSGRKTYEMNGPVGIGWLLNTGGLISRTVHGKRDDDTGINFPEPVPIAETISNKNNWDFLAGNSGASNWSNIIYDTQYDVFSYNFNNKSGNFILKNLNNNKIPETIPNNKMKIQLHKTNTPVPMIDYFEITDESGVFYRFGKSMISNEDNRENTGDYISAWLISEIISANKKDTIHFKYNVIGKLRLNYYELITVRDNHNDIGTNPGQHEYINDVSNVEETNQISYGSARIKEILFKNGKIVFSQDINSDLISKMDVYSDNVIQKSIIFSKSILDSPIGLYTFSIRDKANYKLDRITFQDNGSNPVSQYSFDYYPSTDFNTRQNDWWGYYNGSTSYQYCLIPSYTIPFKSNPMQPVSTMNIGHPEANRIPNEAYAKSGILKSVTYPTGGKTEFFYESNKYLSIKNGIVGSCGGLRISKTIHSENGVEKIIKTFRYGKNESGYGYVHLEPEIGLLGFEQSVVKHYDGIFSIVDCLDEGTFTKEYLRVRYYSSDVLPEYCAYFHEPVMYPEIAIYNGTPENNMGKTILRYETNLKYLALLGPKFESPMDSEIDNSITIKHDKIVDLWKKNNLIEKVVLDKYNLPVKKIIYEYVNNQKDNITGLHSCRYYSVPQGIEFEKCLGFYEYPVYIYDNYIVSSGVQQLHKTTEINYSGLDSIAVQTSDYYNADYLNCKTEKITSQGLFSKVFYYPNDYLNQFPNLVSNNMFALNIDTRSYMNTHLIEGNQFKYNDWGQLLEIYNFENASNDIPFVSSNPFTFSKKQTITYNTDKNPEKVDVIDNVKTYYLWAYNKQYPIAKIETAVNTTINITVDDSQLKKTAVLADIQSDVNYLKGLLNAYVANKDYIVSIYTYKPLVGMTSQTDPAGRTTYYEYDTFNRLKLSRDQNGNVIEKYDYHYANQ